LRSRLVVSISTSSSAVGTRSPKACSLYMTAPLLYAADDEPWVLVPTGFVLSKRVLLTVRSSKLLAFQKVIQELEKSEKIEPAPTFARLLETLVDRMADVLENSASDLDDASHLIFHSGVVRQARLAHETTKLRRLMIRTGRTSERMARVQYTLVCLDRIAKYAAEHCREWIPLDVASRLHLVSSDIASLVQFTEGLVSRVQLLQDAASGIINIDQNEVMKVLTIAGPDRRAERQMAQCRHRASVPRPHGHQQRLLQCRQFRRRRTAWTARSSGRGAPFRGVKQRRRCH
jgi:Mg2+ and Co2+ transporter CorA